MQLRQKYGEITGLGGQVAVVVPDRAENITALASMLKLPYPVLADPLNTLYKVYGLAKGEQLLVGDFVLDSNLVITFAHRGATPEDRPPVAELLSEIGKAAQTGEQND